MMCKKFCLLLICSNLVSSLRLHTNSRLSGFVLVDNNFTYVEELVPSQIDIAGNSNGGNGAERLQDAYNPNERDVVSPAKASVRFEPPILYFKDKVVGNSYRETVFIFNTSQNKTLRMEKIAGGKHSQIQIASFGDELVTPGGNTTFDIIFIGKDLVPLSTHYYIYTSKGILKYDVISWCLENPYRITPMSSITLPLNSSYSHSITLRNPFPEPLQITEALLHGGDYTSHTLPPSIDFENAVQSWTIQPYETKEILRVHFLTYEAWNLTTFQSIKLATGTTLLIPVEVEVIPRTGLYVPGHKIDFESGGHLDPPAIRPLHLCSSAKKTVTIENVLCESRIDGCEVMDFRPTALPPWSCAINPIAKVKFVWSAKIPGEITSGGLVIKNDLDPSFRVNYTARIHHGGLTYNSSLTHYVTGISSFNSAARPFAFTNEYRELVAVINVYLSFEAAEYFHIRGFEPSVLKPQEKKVLFNLQTRKGVKLNELKLDSSILLETNISTIRLPLRVYDGLLTKLSKVAPSSLHLGLVSAKSTVFTYFGLSNSNPETIFVKYFGCNDTSVHIELLDVKPGNARTFYYRSFMPGESGISHAGGFNIHPYHYASFKLSVNTSDTEEEVYAEVWVQSEFQKLSFPLYMNVAKGYIHVSPDPFEFEDCFPGAYCIQQLTVESHFLRSMSIINISTIPYTPYDKLLFYPNMPAIISGHSTSIVGNILWEPTIDSSQTWPLGYLGLPNNRTGRDRWLGTIERPNITRDFDLTLMESQYLRYREQYNSPIDLMFRMDTTEMRNYLFKGRIQLQWPQIVTTRVIDFPLVQIGSVSYENVSVFNPMHSHYMTVQAIMAYHYQQEVPTVIGNMISEFEEPGGIESKSNEFFLDMNIDNPYRFNVLNGTKRKFTNHRSSVVFVLPPQANATVRIGFMPSSQVLTTTRLYLRNDFTILDAVAINGAGAYPQLTLEGLENSAANLIKFVIPYETLKLCEESSNKVLNITTKKVFRLRNTGQVSVHIYGFTINGLPCQGYGFKITNCHNTPFVLKPGMSKRIEIYFTPDFTSARIESNLQVESDIKMGPMLSYTLYAALDSDWLRKCKPHLQRPNWEPLVYYLMIGMFFFLLIGVAIMAVYEVSTHTNRLINGFGGVEEKVQPFYDLKLIELFFVRSSVPHHHHHHNHHHHHHRSSTNSSQTRSEMVAQTASTQAHKQDSDYQKAIANGHVVTEREVANRTNTNVTHSERHTTPLTVSSSSDTQSAQTTVTTALCSSQTLIYNCNLRSNNSSDSVFETAKSRYSPANSNTEKRERNSTSTDSRISVQQTHNHSSTADSGCAFVEDNSSYPKSKKGKKYNVEEVCHKSNWFKRQAKKEEKLSGTKFLKNECIRSASTKADTSASMRKDTTKCADEKRCGAAERSSATVVAASTNEVVASKKEASNNDQPSVGGPSAASANGNVTKFAKDAPRKLDFTTRCATKKSSSSSSSSSNSSSNGELSSEKNSSSACMAEKNEELYTIKVSRQRKKKTPELMNKFNETTTKENIKENVAYSYKSSSENAKKSPAKEKSRSRPPNNERKEEQTKSPDPADALKPITNLPKSKEPFETLSSLCNDTINLKSKRKPNTKKRAKDDKFVDLARELSIVFTTPETIDRKPAKKTVPKTAGNEKTKKKSSMKKPETSMEQRRNTINREKSGSVFHDAGNRQAVENGRVLRDVGADRSNAINTNKLYSTIVAPPGTRSSSSSSSSDSMASYESPGTMKFIDNSQSQNLVWNSWNNTSPQGDIMPSNSHVFDMPSLVENKNGTSLNFGSPPSLDSPEFVLLGEESQNLMSEELFCSHSHGSKTDSDEMDDSEWFNFPKASVSDEEDFRTPPLDPTPSTKPLVDDIWGPPTSSHPWTPAGLNTSSYLKTDEVSSISLSRLLLFKYEKEKDTDSHLNLLWTSTMRSIWGHPKKE